MYFDCLSEGEAMPRLDAVYIVEEYSGARTARRQPWKKRILHRILRRDFKSRTQFPSSILVRATLK